MANTELLKKVRQVITERPDLWDQRKWAARPVTVNPDKVEATCNTQMCIAGWACHLSGAEIDWNEGEYDGDKYVAHRLQDGRLIEDAAEDYLGLSRGDASELFYSFSQGICLDLLDQLIEHDQIVD